MLWNLYFNVLWKSSLLEWLLDLKTLNRSLRSILVVFLNILLGVFYWNDQRSRHVFLCFCSAIFQLTSAKFQTFAYNSRTIWSSCMKFWQQFEINELYVWTQFRGNWSRDFGFRTRKPPRKFGVKSGLSQKRLKYGKKYFIWLYVLRQGRKSRGGWGGCMPPKLFIVPCKNREIVSA